MEINKEEENKILNLLTNSIQDKNYELECIIGNMNNDFVSKEDFINVLKRFKGKRKYARMSSSSILSISFSNDREYALFNKKVSRVILPSNGIINVYNKTNKLDNILNNIRVERKYFDKERTIREKHKIINEDYNIRYNLKIEEEIDKTSDVVTKLLRDWKKIPKYFRRKQTYTFYHESDDFKVDISIISQNENNKYTNTLQESGVLQNKNISYELEVEYIGNKKDNIENLFKNKDSLSQDYKQSVLNNFLEVITSVLQAKQQSLFLMSNKERLKVDEKIRNLIKNPADDFFLA